MKVADITFLIPLVLVAVGVLALCMASDGQRRSETRSTTSQPDGPSDTGVVYSPSGYDITPLTRTRIDTLAEGLTPEERDILLRKGTEPPQCGRLLNNKAEGTYACRLCGLPLFSSQTKFESGTGWPSFFRPFDPAHVLEIRDAELGMARTETACARCRSHLGHVFSDGPRPTGLRYCMNSAALKFHAAGAELPPESRPIETATAYFAGGCFWGIEDRFQQVPGVIDAVSGYQGGHVANPVYKQVCQGDTGHAEAVRVTFDPSQVTYLRLLEWFFKFHDPTQRNRQGPDLGTQYRSAIFATDSKQLTEAKKFVMAQQDTTRFRDREIATVVEPAGIFYEAEDNHQDYHAKHGGSCAISSGE